VDFSASDRSETSAVGAPMSVVAAAGLGPLARGPLCLGHLTDTTCQPLGWYRDQMPVFPGCNAQGKAGSECEQRSNHMSWRVRGVGWEVGSGCF